MATFRQVQISFWQDTFVLGLTSEEKYFYMYLLTNSKTQQCGIYEISTRIMLLETGYNEETISKLIKKFIDYEKIEYDYKTHEIFLKNWLKYNSCRSPKVLIKVKDEIKNIKSVQFRKSICSLLKDYGESIDTELQEEKKEEQNNKDKIEQEAFFEKAIPQFLSSDKKFVETWRSWVYFNRERGTDLVPRQVKEQLEYLKIKTATEGIELIKTAITNNWKGLKYGNGNKGNDTKRSPSFVSEEEYKSELGKAFGQEV